MVRIVGFREKWDAYKPRAHLISPHFQEFGEHRRITQDDVAARIPKDTHAAVPATCGNGIAGAAFGAWLANEAIPDERVKQWEALTRVPVAVWGVDLAGLERTLRQRTGEILGWAGLVKEARRGRIQIRLRDRPQDAADQQAGYKFNQYGFDPDAAPVDVRLVWPGCIANIAVPAPMPRDEPEDRRAWLLADYGDRVFVLDPGRPTGGPASSSRIGRSAWHADRREGHIVLPQVAPGYVWLPPSTPLGTRFEAIVLTLNLNSQAEAIRLLFDDLERRLLVDLRETPPEAYQRTVQAVLEEAAALIEGHDVGYVLYTQACEVVDRSRALGAGHE